ncbi:exodeoxyribonuclease VII large subunit [Gilvimarinus polysaccharolyticus]|uniref:exodeoxyribonuclease VII large subunit n=1 Tax=Gilvimarinus polysaccharolyticus TaxID=863921 RepID=UPI00067319AE|nr:exodeoxyribonuclease VII large subunit [Gilvimarinus polysaccharolyticus]
MTNTLTNTANNPTRKIHSVTALNRLSRQLLEPHLPMVWVEGEISNFAKPSSGHWYFTLKDDAAQVRCAMFRSRSSGLRFTPQQGEQVLLRARVSLYEGRGDYQLIAEHMEPAGHGALQRAYEQLKNKLASEGLFEPERKQTLPELPRHIGVITSPTGAAIRDVLSVLQRRYPAIPVTVIPVPVQGTEAAPAIVRALALAARSKLFDVLLVTRGGGSLEDLWPFNDERVARAISLCPIPIISAVGHEVDTTIADYVADVRAPTPSAAAELVVPDMAEQLTRLQVREHHLGQAIQRRLLSYSEQLKHLQKRLRHPGDNLKQQAQRLDQLELRLNHIMARQLERNRQKLANLKARQPNPSRALQEIKTRLTWANSALLQQWQTSHQRASQRLSENAHLLQSVSPLSTLGRGYALITDAQGVIVRDSNDVQSGDTVTAKLAQGELRCRVLER